MLRFFRRKGQSNEHPIDSSVGASEQKLTNGRDQEMEQTRKQTNLENVRRGIDQETMDARRAHIQEMEQTRKQTNLENVIRGIDQETMDARRAHIAQTIEQKKKKREERERQGHLEAMLSNQRKAEEDTRMFRERYPDGPPS